MLKSYLSNKNHEFSLPDNNANTKDAEALFDETHDADAVNVCRQRMFIAIVAFLFIYFAIVIRVFYVCLNDGIRFHTFEDISSESELKTDSPISRADITDRNGIIIATSLPTVNLYANPKHVQNVQDVAEKLSLLFPEISYEDLVAKLSRKHTVFSMIKYNLSPAQQSAVNSLGIPALEFNQSEKRVYPHNNLFSHILGYTNIDNLGLAGIEKQQHKRLTESSKPLQLTVDAGVQDAIREELIAAVKNFKANGAAAIVMNTNTGEIISMVSVPDYNPNLSIQVGDKSLFNFATQGVYEAGSVFKTFNTALGLESGKVKVNDKFDATKPIKVQGAKITDYRGENRWLSVGEVLIHSSNIGSVQMVLRVGKEKQRQFLQNLGFEDPLSDFEVAEKARPLFPSKQKWRDDTMATASYGYGLSVTPLHLISAFSALVNGGIYHYPTIIKGSHHQSRRVISKSTSDKMRPLLRDVVILGSGKKANVAGYQVIGKTGTANKLINGRYKNKVVMTSFLAAFPENNPQYTLMLVFDEPKSTPETMGFVTSGWNAVPVGGKIIGEIAPQLNIQADFDLDTQRKHVKAVFEK